MDELWLRLAPICIVAVRILLPTAIFAREKTAKAHPSSFVLMKNEREFPRDDSALLVGAKALSPGEFSQGISGQHTKCCAGS
jgi:hypothetical protein